jgi:hypothetical protein
MKLRILVVALVALAVSASTAIAVPPPGKGKPETAGKPSPTGPTCKPKVTVVLKGDVTSASATSLSMDVTRANRWGRAWLDAGTATVAMNEDTTKVRRNGVKLATALLTADWVLVQARVCKADLDDATPPALTAVRVVAHPAQA